MNRTSGASAPARSMAEQGLILRPRGGDKNQSPLLEEVRLAKTILLFVTRMDILPFLSIARCIRVSRHWKDQRIKN